MNSEHFYCLWMGSSFATDTEQQSTFKLNTILYYSKTPTVHTISGTWWFCWLTVMLPASLSVVNRACVVYGNVGHLFVVLFGIRPKVEVNDCWVDAAGLCISFLHQLAKALFDQFHRPNGTTSDLDLSPVSWTEQLTWEKHEMDTKRKVILVHFIKRLPLMTRQPDTHTRTAVPPFFRACISSSEYRSTPR